MDERHWKGEMWAGPIRKSVGGVGGSGKPSAPRPASSPNTMLTYTTLLHLSKPETLGEQPGPSAHCSDSKRPVSTRCKPRAAGL
jgi:hypothetical protein